MSMSPIVEVDAYSRSYVCMCQKHGQFKVPFSRVTAHAVRSLSCHKCQKTEKKTMAESVTEWMGNPS